MKTKTKRKGYSFAQLSKEAKEAARDWFRETDDLSDLLSETLANDLSDHFGITGCKIFFGLNHCQGDGVCFHGRPEITNWSQQDETLKAMLTELNGLAGLMNFKEPSFSIDIQHTGNYCHAYSMDLTLQWVEADDGWNDQEQEPWQQDISDKVNALEKYLQERIIAVAHELEKIGYAEIEYHESDEYIAESADANDYRFTKKGEPLCF